jgi:pyridoxal phosphate enzyme (YggS family)
MNDFAQRLSAVYQRIRNAEDLARRDAGSVTLLAVSKTVGADYVRACAEAGQRQFGENYVQEGVEKVRALRDLDLEWHFIGPLQSNKTRAVAEHFHWVHSVDRLKIAQRLSEQRPSSLPPLQVCLQVNVSQEATKSGLSLSELPAIAAAVRALPRLRLRGLMAIPAPAHDLESQRRPFALLRQAWEQLKADIPEVDTLSMGMSEDLEAAIMEGSTVVRVGTAIFGARVTKG